MRIGKGKGDLTMSDGQLNLLIGILATVTLFELMMTIGLGVTFAEVVGVASNWRLVGQAALANYVCVPAFAVGLLLLFRPHSLDPDQFPLIAAGFLIAAVRPGAPYGPPFTGMAKGNVVVSVGLMVILAGSSALVAPILLRFLLPLTSGDQRVQIDTVRMVGTLLFSQLLPLCAWAWRAPVASDPGGSPQETGPLAEYGPQSGHIGDRPHRPISDVDRDSFQSVCRNVRPRTRQRLRGLAAGWAGQRNRKAVAMATSVRNVGVSLVIATASFPGTKAVTAATAFALFQTIVMALVALCWGRLTSASQKKTSVQEFSTLAIEKEPAQVPE